MKEGGNEKCNNYLKSKGIPPTTKIKEKYESEHAQLYKEKLKARVEGRPEPTSLPPPRNKRATGPSSGNMSGFGSSSGSGGSMGSTDPNGLERMVGETDQQYIARQTRLKAEAKARMQAKFGNGGRMGGVGSSMQGIGSNSGYNPATGSYGSGGGYGDMGNMVGNLTGAFSSGLSMVSSAVTDDSTRASVSNLANTATAYGGSLASTGLSVGGSFWNTLKSTAGNVATAVTTNEPDGLAALQRDVKTHMPSTSKYSGFGSTNTATPQKPPSSSSGSFFDSFGTTPQQPMTSFPRVAATPPPSGGLSVQEAPGLPHEDRNGMERLTGETDEQYVVRQTRLREEAKARMAAKFGNGGLSGAGPSSSSYSSSSSSSYKPAMGNGFGSTGPSSGGATLQEAQGLPGEDRNGMERLTGETEEQYVLRQTRLRDEAKARMAAKFGGGGMSGAGPSSSSYSPAPSSGNRFGSVPSAPATAPSYPTGMSLGAKKATPVKAPSSFGNPSNNGFGRTPVRKNSHDSPDDFFANFGA